jgi:hypothetical protein
MLIDTSKSKVEVSKKGKRAVNGMPQLSSSCRWSHNIPALNARPVPLYHPKAQAGQLRKEAAVGNSRWTLQNALQDSPNRNSCVQ